MGSLVGPITGAPREPRIASGFSVVVSFHNGKFGSRSMPGTVWDAGGALPVAVPLACAVEDSFETDEAATEEATGTDGAAGELAVLTAELMRVEEEGGAGAAAVRLARNSAQRQEERRIIVQCILEKLQKDVESMCWVRALKYARQRKVSRTTNCVKDQTNCQS